MMLHEHIYEDMKQDRSNGPEDLSLFGTELIKEPAEKSSETSAERSDEEDRPNLE